MQSTQDADVGDMQRNEDLSRLFQTGVEAPSYSMVITGADLGRPGPTILYVNPAFEKMTGYQADDVIGLSPRLLQGEQSDPVTLRKMRASLNRWESFRGNIVN